MTSCHWLFVQLDVMTIDNREQLALINIRTQREDTHSFLCVLPVQYSMFPKLSFRTLVFGRAVFLFFILSTVRRDNTFPVGIMIM